MMNRDQLLDTLAETLQNFRYALTRRILTVFPTLAALLSNVRDLLGSIDIHHACSLPTETIQELNKLVNEATKSVREYMMNSHAPEDAISDGVVRPLVLARTPENISRWENHLSSINNSLFTLSSAIVAHQQKRVNTVATSHPIRIEKDESKQEGNPDDPVWRYMPLRNLIRCERACGLWFSSLKQLAVWSDRGIVDTHEGQVPPLLTKLRDEYELVFGRSPEEIEKFKHHYNLAEQDYNRLPSILHLAFHTENIFVSSWSQKHSESSNMWMHYGDNGQGIAVKSRIGKLFECDWRVPVELSSLSNSNRFRRLIIRPVNYLKFDQTDTFESVNDLYLPFLKRREFDDEKEVRLIGFADKAVVGEGVTLLCNLPNLMDEIVVGPKGNLDHTRNEIARYAPDLREVPVNHSKLT